MNRRAFLPESHLKFARGQFNINGNDCEARSRMRDLFDLFKVIKVIGRNVNYSVRPERCMDGAQEIWRYDPPPMMTPLGPGIGKQEIECFH